MDLIDRQALLKQIEIDSDGEPGYYGDTWKFIDTIKNLPPATDKNVGTEHGTNLAEVGTDCISRQAAIDALTEYGNGRAVFISVGEAVIRIEQLPSVQPEWNNHKVACLLAELFDDTCACNYNGIDEWLPSKCELLDSCPHPVGVACWEQYLKHRTERRTDE